MAKTKLLDTCTDWFVIVLPLLPLIAAIFNVWPISQAAGHQRKDRHVVDDNAPKPKVPPVKIWKSALGEPPPDGKTVSIRTESIGIRAGGRWYDLYGRELPHDPSEWAEF